MPKPTIESFTPRDLGPKDWGTETLVAETPAYIAKVLRMRAGATGPLQHHVQKMESFHLYSGRALVEYVDEDEQHVLIHLNEGQTIHVPCGAVHRVEAMTDCVFFEASLPVFDDRVPFQRPVE